MHAIKWLVIALSTCFMSCTIVEDGNCLQESRNKVCHGIESDIAAAWDDCYDGNNPNRDDLIQYFIDAAYQRCFKQECLPEEITLDCAGSTWVCVETMSGQDIIIPDSCGELLDF